jgi:hypothetical protein
MGSCPKNSPSSREVLQSSLSVRPSFQLFIFCRVVPHEPQRRPACLFTLPGTAPIYKRIFHFIAAREPFV